MNSSDLIDGYYPVLFLLNFTGSREDTDDYFGSGYWTTVAGSSLLASNSYNLVSDGDTLYAIATYFVGGQNR